MESQDNIEYRKKLDSLQRELDRLRQLLSCQLEDEELPNGPSYLLTCRIGAERAAFLMWAVDRVVLLPKLTPLPDAPNWIAGALTLKNQTFPVIDVHARLSGGPHTPELDHMVLIVESNERQLGLIVHEIFDVVRLPVRAHLSSCRGVPHADYLHGVLQIGDDPHLLLSIPRLLYPWSEVKEQT
jgi:purine-binding chemotaxis protein CheW